ncbi:hypothetical protein G6L94_27625 [Agrobacterium rhizogenes]|uniref:hypothetical protein n=2 Tax=Rhizobium rhizogenes TaxID=359 RepID=UPI0004D4B229|nr:hypothetical protein [Rhizobium rhizogenes]OCJ15417.1 hypothetical protein A6U89_19400 [Agrobacterium sp. B133/95]KEA09047.1 hypothetical protein CN09_25610 [Rhizobium rhizogenes]MQB30960.1 hypothetical protein [Rhizobium rhizogenes]NTF71737.1 hypothetical protein [Rhizobium rhizogenes]NTF90372.1 hypothetical protein [Rhizobium rhizogenes]
MSRITDDTDERPSSRLFADGNGAICHEHHERSIRLRRDGQENDAEHPGRRMALQDSCLAEGSKMNRYWKTYLDHAKPPGAVADFSASAFVLQVAFNLRLALKLVEPTPECLYLAERVLASAEIYSQAREEGLALPFTEAEKALAEAVALLATELERCPSASRGGGTSLLRRHPQRLQPSSSEEGRQRGVSP